MSEHIWERVLGRVEAKLNRHTFLTWFKPTRFIRENGDTLIIGSSPVALGGAPKNKRGPRRTLHRSSSCLSQ